MPKSELIIFHHEPLTKAVRHNFFINGLESKGFKILYCDVHHLVIGELEVCDREKNSSCITVFSYEQVAKIIAEHQNAIYILAFEANLKSLPILQYLTFYSCRTVRIGIHTAINLSLKDKLMNIRSYGWNKVPVFLMTLLDRLLFTCKTINSPLKEIDIFFYCGENSRLHNSAKRMIAINSFDYEDVRQQLQPIPSELGSKRFAVFLDQYYPYHPDVKIDGGKPPTPAFYFESLNRLFNRIEQEIGLEVLIAAHPKAEYNNHEFGARKLYKYRTAELVRASDLVIAHDSMAVSFAILYKRPIYFCYTSEFLKMGRSTMAMMRKNAQELNCPLIPLDNDYKLILPVVNDQAYSAYQYSYLTSRESENLSNIDILSNALCSLDC